MRKFPVKIIFVVINVRQYQRLRYTRTIVIAMLMGDSKKDVTAVH